MENTHSWSEFQKPCQTVGMRDEAKLRTREVSNKQAGWNKKVGLNFLSFLKTSRMD